MHAFQAVRSRPPRNRVHKKIGVLRYRCSLSLSSVSDSELARSFFVGEQQASSHSYTSSQRPKRPLEKLLRPPYVPIVGGVADAVGEEDEFVEIGRHGHEAR